MTTRNGVAIEGDVILRATPDAHRCEIEDETLAEKRRVFRVDCDEAIAGFRSLFGVIAQRYLDDRRDFSFCVELAHVSFFISKKWH